jgi:hypothetical protein
MSKQRMIRDSFWTDSYVERLTPDEKLIFLYLLTNPLCNIGGIYEIRTKRIGFETGYDIEVIENILKRFERDKKILRHNDWICMVNHLKNQAMNPSVIQGCQRIFAELPPEIDRMVTGWVQGGLLNLTILNLTSPNSTEISEPQEETKKPTKTETSLSFLEKLPPEVTNELSEKYHISPKGIQSKATDLLLYCKQKGKVYKDYKAFLENALRKDKAKLQEVYPLEKKVEPQKEVELTPEQTEKNRQIRENITNMLKKKTI